MAMYRDVLAAALACPNIDSVAVVTRDTDALAVAAEAGAEGLPEPGGLNEALTSAAEKMTQRGATELVVLASDLPLANADEIAAVVEAEAEVAIVPAADGGTNALALPAGAIAFQFGPESANKHLASARKAGLHSMRLDLPALAFDIDSPDDLARLRATESSASIGPHTVEALGRLAAQRSVGSERTR